VTAVIIGVDPHELSATIEVLDGREKVLGGDRFGTDGDGYRQMLAAGRRWPQRVWAVEGSNGIGDAAELYQLGPDLGRQAGCVLVRPGDEHG